MNITVLLAHPDPNSFNHAIVHTAITLLKACGHAVHFHDLYAERFDPIITTDEIPGIAAVPQEIVGYCDEIRGADGIIIVHPNWWGQPPAILKGWVDRVLRPGVAYRFLEGDAGEGVPVGLLKAKAALVFNTANTPAARERDCFGDPLQLLWKNCIFGLCGVSVFHREMFTMVVTSTPAQRREWLGRVAQTVNRVFPRQAQPIRRPHAAVSRRPKRNS